ncbi:MAG: hypothetical protein ACOX3T_04430 [Bdellovibrionota bacterium]
MNQTIITIIIFTSIGVLGIVNLASMKNKFTIEAEAQNIFNNLSLLSLNQNKNICLKTAGKQISIFNKETKAKIKTFNVDKKISLTTTTTQVCCKNLTCTPSTINLSLKNYTCKIIISLRGQIKKVCKKE